MIPVPLLPPGQVFAAVGPRRATRWRRALTPSHVFSARVMLNMIRWRLAAEIHRSDFDAAFATRVRERPDALLVAGDAFFVARRGQLATLAASEKIPAAYSIRDHVVAGGLMSYGTDLADMFRQVGFYTGNILKGAKPTGLPVLQTTEFEFVINRTTAKAGLTIPAGVLSIADEVIE